MTSEALYTNWQKVCCKYTADSSLIEEAYRLLIAAYTSKGRYYHTLAHIKTLLADAGEFFGENEVPDELFFAIWFHDAVYNTTSTSNEEHSAVLAAKWLNKLQVPEYIIAQTGELINKTANHLAANAEDNITQFFLDADLKILGADEESYQAYCDAVRKEYSIYPDFIYSRGRKKFTEKALAATRIYRTEKFYLLYEKQARKNLMNELNQLV